MFNIFRIYACLQKLDIAILTEIAITSDTCDNLEKNLEESVISIW